MTTLSAKPAASTHVRAGAAALLLLSLTALHHIYGAIIYETPWRLHIVQAAVPAAIVISVALFVGHSRRGTSFGRAATWLAAIIIVVFPVAVVGLYEGGYNHLLKNLFYFGFGEDVARTLFPAPVYKLPNDLIFEVTGIAQFPLSVLAALLTISLLRRTGR